MKCPNCGKADLVHTTKDMPYTYKGHETIIPNVEAEHCPNCGEAVIGLKEGTRTGQLMVDFNKSINTTKFDPAFFLAVRVKYGLDQRQAADIFGGGVNAFSRYETGKAVPPLALVKLFKVLDRHPELMEEIRAA